MALNQSEKVQRFLEKVRQEYGGLPKDLHITRKACALVAISEGKVILSEKPAVKYCPLFKSLFSQDQINESTIEKKFDRQIKEWGMFTCKRNTCDEKIIVPFGASEMMMYALKRKGIDAAVIACEGAGTVITDNPGVVQGIGAYMNGLFYTSPINEVIKRIQKDGATVLSPEDARIDQVGGLKAAISKGYKKIAVTARGDESHLYSTIRDIEKDCGAEVVLLAICNSGISEDDALNIRRYCDLAWACASKPVREIVGPASILQVGMKIPVFVITGKGISFISNYSSDKSRIDKPLDSSKHYITSNKYEKGGIKTNMGKFSVYLYQTDSLPVYTEDEPDPLV